MGLKERREREKEVVRGKILDAARELFVAEGYEAVTMRKIAQAIEYSPTAIYLHFRDKEAVINAICDTDFLQLATRFRKIAEVADPIARLRASGLAYADFALRHPNHYRLMFMTPAPAALAGGERHRGRQPRPGRLRLRAVDGGRSDRAGAAAPGTGRRRARRPDRLVGGSRLGLPADDQVQRALGRLAAAEALDRGGHRRLDPRHPAPAPAAGGGDRRARRKRARA